MTQEATEYDTTGALQIASFLYPYVDVLQKKVFIGAQKQQIHQFAMAIGIQRNIPLEKADWKEEPDDKAESQPGSQLSSYSSVTAILDTLACVGQLDVNKSPNQILSEYTNGGLAYLREIHFEDQSEEALSMFFEEFDHLVDAEDNN